MSQKIGEEPDPDSQLVGRARKSGGKSGEGKEQLAVDIQQRIDQLWQEIVTTKLYGLMMHEAWKKNNQLTFNDRDNHWIPCEIKAGEV